MTRSSRAGALAGQGALVLGTGRATVAAARSLADGGLRVVLGICGDAYGADRSRAVAESWQHPALTSGPSAFDDALRALLATRSDIRHVFPATEEAVIAMSRRAGSLPPRVTLASVRSDIVATCQDKLATLELAAEVGLPFAPYQVVDSLPALRAAARSIGFPAILRPVRAPARLFDRKALILSSAAQLERLFVRWPAEHSSLLLQAYVSGPRHNVYIVAAGGDIVASWEVRVLRTDRSDGTGVAVAGQAGLPTPALTRCCEVLIERLDYTGIALAQFIIPEPPAPACLIELNPRLGANAAFLHDCGVNLPVAACLLGAGSSPDLLDLPSAWPVGRRYAWTYGDLAGLAHQLRHDAIAPLGAIGWLGRCASSAARADAHLTFQWRDPLPAAGLVRSRLRRWLGG